MCVNIKIRTNMTSTDIPEKARAHYERVWADFAQTLSSYKKYTLRQFCRDSNTNYWGMKKWLEARGLTVRDLKREVRESKPAAPQAPSFIRFVPEPAAPVQAGPSAVRGACVVFPNGVRMAFTEIDAASLAALASSYSCAEGGAGGCSI